MNKNKTREMMEKMRVGRIVSITIVAIIIMIALGGAGALYGVTNLGSLHLSDINTTATPIFMVNQRGTGPLMELRDSGTPVVQVVNGGGFVMSSDTDLNGNSLIMDADADTSLTADTDDQIDIEIASTDEITLTAARLSLNDTFLYQAVGTENLGTNKTVVSQVITWTAAAGGSGTLATIADGEIWFVHNVFIRTTTNFDATGDDVTFTIGDGNDADGFIVAADANLQATFTEATGYAAGWYGIENGSGGAYTLDDGGPFVYAPSGAAETIDWVIDETSGETITAGQLTAYLIYTRIQ